MGGLRSIAELFVSDGVIWLNYESPGSGGPQLSSDRTVEELSRLLQPLLWRDVWRALTGSEGGGIQQHWVPQTLEILKAAQKVPANKVDIIPAKRQVGPASEGFKDYSGRGLIDRLAEAQSPDITHRDDRVLFSRINDFLRTVTGIDDARIEIPHNRAHILINMGGRLLPLSSLGTGIHEVVLIASFCTLSNASIVCIEEPEIHLHPILQRKLIAYLKETTDNQYFIATHSPSLLDSVEASIYHVRHEGDQTTFSSAKIPSERHNICADLGCKASDIIQSNAVIWVEGPSDRIYLNHWIKAVDRKLVENLHYTVMFYGGRLLSHLSADDEEVEDFIALRPLNRNTAILIDSDKATPQSTLNATKRRLIEEFENGGSIAWVTAGREVENYINPEVLQQAVKEVHSVGYASPAPVGRYDHALHFIKKAKGGETGEIQTKVDKVKVAHRVADTEADMTILDLRDRVNAIVDFVRSANQ